MLATIARMANPPPREQREILTWADFGEGSRALAQQVADSGFEPDIVLAIARGGLLPGGAIAYALPCKNVFVMNVEFYTGINQRLDFPVMLPPQLDILDIRGAKVLIVDDVADTGSTLKAVLEFIATEVKEARSAVLYEKPISVVHADFVWRRTDRWIDFPWSDQPPVTDPAGEGH